MLSTLDLTVLQQESNTAMSLFLTHIVSKKIDTFFKGFLTLT